MANNYIPGADGEFVAWEQNLLLYANANLVALGLVAGDLTALTTLQGDWETLWQDWQAKQAAAQAATQAKNDKRAEFESALRAFVAKLQASSAVDDTERQALGIPVRDGQATPVAVPTTRPVLVLKLGALYQIIIGFADEGTPTKKAKPAGVTGAFIQYFVGVNPPTSDAQWQFLAIDSATPYVATYDSAEAGQTVWFRARWMNSRNQFGPWGAAVSGKVPG